MESIKNLLPLTKELSLLYVEDDIVVQNEWASLLGLLFREVLVADNGKIGLDSYRENRPDLIITDINMPVMDGLEMATAIRSENQQIPIVMITARHDEQVFLKSIEIGIDAFLPKPIEKEHFFRTLYKVVKVLNNQKIARNERQYFEVLTQSSIVSKSDIEGNITYVNDNFCAVTGYAREELMGRSHNILRHIDSTNALFKDMWDTILSGKVWRGEMKNINKDGSCFLADTIIIPLKDARGEIYEFTAIRQDVTKLAELKQKVLEEELKINEQKKIAKTKEAFLILFTHELKTPLNAIINFSKYIRKKIEKPQALDTEKISALLDSIIDNASESLEQITDILDISKLKAHQLSFHRTRFSVNALVKELLERYDSLIRSNGIDMSMHAPQEYWIDSDRHRVKQIVTNILSNAIKYGKDKIHITVESGDTSVTVCVEDNGPGIEEKEAVFNLYEQGDGSLYNRKSQGTGIGLHFVKMICKNLNIQYSLEDSEKLGGTRFTFRFPLYSEKGLL